MRSGACARLRVLAAVAGLGLTLGCGGTHVPPTVGPPGSEPGADSLVLSGAAPRGPSISLAQVSAWIAADSLSRAERVLDHILAEDSLRTDAWSLYSLVLDRSGRPAEALHALQRLRRRLHGRLPLELRADLALHLSAAGAQREAETLLDSLYVPGRHWRTIGSVLATVAIRGERRDRAIDAARLAFAADSSRATHCNNRGIAYLMEGNPVAARAVLERACRLDPALPGPLYNLAITEQFYFFDEPRARDWFERYLTLSDDDPDNLKAVLGPSSARR